MSDWAFINKHRVASGAFANKPEDGWNGFAQFRLNNLPINCIFSDGHGWKHCSVSIYGSNMPPSWAIMCKVKDLFWEPEDWVVQFHPAHSEYVNNHPGVLHLWQPTETTLPKPDSLMVGVRNIEDMRRANADPESPYKFLFSESKTVDSP